MQRAVGLLSYGTEGTSGDSLMEKPMNGVMMDRIQTSIMLSHYSGSQVYSQSQGQFTVVGESSHT